MKTRITQIADEMNQQILWDAYEMEHHTNGGLFNPYDIELPNIETKKIHGQIEIVPGRPTDWTYETAVNENGEIDTNPPRVYGLFSGFGGIKASSGPFSNAMAKSGMDLLTVEPIRADDRSCKERLFDPHAIYMEAVSGALDQLKEETGISPNRRKNGTKLITIGHSMGGEPALRYAEEHHKVTEAVVLIATIGFGSPNIKEIFKKLPSGIIPSITEEFIPFFKSDEMEISICALKKAIGYFASNPMRTIGEVGSCLTSDQNERVHRLRENHNIPTVYAQPVFDILVQGIEGARRSVDVVGNMERSGHMVIQAKPARAAKWISSALNTFELTKVAA